MNRIIHLGIADKLRIRWHLMVGFVLVSMAFATAKALEKSVNRLSLCGKAYREFDFTQCAKFAASIELSRLLNPDVALFLQAQCLFYAGQIEHARSVFLRIVRDYPQSPHAQIAIARAADCSWELGHKAQAVESYQTLTQAVSAARVDKAVGMIHQARFLYQTGKSQEGRLLWLEMLKRFPAHPLASLTPLEGREILLSFEESMDLARAFHRARMWDNALEIVDSAKDPDSDPQRFEMAFITGRLVFDKRFHYQQAAEMLFAARDCAPSQEKKIQAWLFGSRALGRCNRDDEAIRSHLAMVKAYPKAKQAPQALYFAGWLAQNLQRCRSAQKIFARLQKKYPQSRYGSEAVWFRAWCYLKASQFARAIPILLGEQNQEGWQVGGRALYWLGVGQLRLGQKKLAKKTFFRLCKRYPLTWYARLARIRLDAAAPPNPVVPTRSALHSVGEKDELLQRGAELIQAQLPSFARLLYRKNEKSFMARVGGKEGRVRLMDAYRAAGDFNRPWYLSMVYENQALVAAPDEKTLPIWQHSYSACQRDLLQKYALGDESFVLFLQAIMRTESGFDPMALSVANARGLMQMIPPTASIVAQELGWRDYSDDGLFDPERNIQTAAHYIGGLLRKFKRQWPLAAGAYNGSVKAMMKWCRRRPHMELDAFVEAIPYTETRRYAKRVLTAMIRYAFLEGKKQPVLRLELDCDYLEQGPNY